jgi:hypothetical protein
MLMRRTRILVNGAVYHITVKVNGGRMIFDEFPEARVLLMQYMQRALKKFNFTLVNFSINLYPSFRPPVVALHFLLNSRLINVYNRRVYGEF